MSSNSCPAQLREYAPGKGGLYRYWFEAMVNEDAVAGVCVIPLLLPVLFCSFFMDLRL